MEHFVLQVHGRKWILIILLKDLQALLFNYQSQWSTNSCQITNGGNITLGPSPTDCGFEVNVRIEPTFPLGTWSYEFTIDPNNRLD